jgi:hypothetical protein
MQKNVLSINGKKITKIIFLTLRPVSEFEEDKWGFGYLRSQEFEVEIFDLTKILNKGQDLHKKIIDSVSNSLKGDFIHHINSYRELDFIVQRFSDNAIFIDYLTGVSAVTLRTERVFRILKKNNARYTFLLSGELPQLSSSATDARSKGRILLSKVIKAINNPSKLLNYFSSKVIRILTKSRIIYPLPTLIFGGNSEVLESYIRRHNFDKRKIVPIHSSDYDACILFLRKFGNKFPENQDICVFLDEAATHHSDFDILGMKPAIADLYFSTINHFFDFVEENMSLKVVIAAHPRSDYDSMPGVFSGRTIIKGQTVELVARSKLVVMHMSTALSYAVFFRKPVMALKIPGLGVNNQMNLMVEAMGAAIGSVPIDLDRDKLTSDLLQQDCNLEKYAEYESRYMKSLGADEMSTWEIVAKIIKNIEYR